MHVCNVISTPYPPWEGIGQYIRGYSTKLLEKGHQVTIITRGPWKKTQRETIDGIELIKVPFFPLYPFYIHLHGLFVNNLFKSLEPQVDIVHIHSPLSPLVKTSLPVIVTIHSPLLSDSEHVEVRSLSSLLTKISARLVSYPLELKLINASDMVTTVSNSVAQELQSYQLDPKTVRILYNGVDETFFSPQPNKQCGGTKNILYVGRITREKGLFDLIEAGRYICDKRSDVHFTCVGNGKELGILKQNTRTRGLEDKFTFTGQVDKKRLLKLYHDADIFVFPSYHEGFPTVLLEAMACGLPIVATDVNGNRDVLSAGKNGVLVPPKSPKGMAEAILTLIENEPLADTLGTHARKTVEENYTWDIVTNRILECYYLLDGRRS